MSEAAGRSGEFEARSDKPVLRINRRHHDSVITQDFVHGAAYAFRGLLHDGARVVRGESTRQSTRVKA